MSDTPPVQSDHSPAVRTRQATPRAPRRLTWLFVGVVGCGVHALLQAVSHAGWLVLGERLPAKEAVSALLASASVVLTLTAMCPSLAWWLLALMDARHDTRHVPAWELTLRVGELLAQDPRARSDAFRATLTLHTLLAAPTVGVVLTLYLRGPVWAALGLLLLWPSLWLAALRLGMRRHPQRLRMGRSEAGQRPQGVKWVFRGLAVTTSTLGLGATLLVIVPAPTLRAGSCAASEGGPWATLPAILPGTALSAEATARAITLSAPDGGGPGRIPLATCGWLSCTVVPTRVEVEQRGNRRVATLCPASGASADDGDAQQVELAAAGYRLEDTTARRMLRSDISAAIAGVLVLLGFVYARWGSRALLQWATCALPQGTPSPQARIAVLTALALGGTQLGWLLVTWLGP